MTFIIEEMQCDHDVYDQDISPVIDDNVTHHITPRRR